MPRKERLCGLAAPLGVEEGDAKVPEVEAWGAKLAWAPADEVPYAPEAVPYALDELASAPDVAVKGRKDATAPADPPLGTAPNAAGSPPPSAMGPAGNMEFPEECKHVFKPLIPAPFQLLGDAPSTNGYDAPLIVPEPPDDAMGPIEGPVVDIRACDVKDGRDANRLERGVDVRETKVVG